MEPDGNYSLNSCMRPESLLSFNGYFLIGEPVAIQNVPANRMRKVSLFFIDEIYYVCKKVDNHITNPQLKKKILQI